MQKRIVVALGGNAIITADGTAQSQQESIYKTMTAVVQFIKKGYELVITHGNGPQVGNLLLQQMMGNTDKTPAMPLDTVGAMTQGEIGYWMQKALDEVLKNEGIKKAVATIVTMTQVCAKDSAFKTPTKPIGPFYTAEEMEKQKSLYPHFVYVEDAGRGYRRVVPSPQPLSIVEAPVINLMLKNDMVAIASGGGGIPVVMSEDGSHIKGVEAVIDKDFSAAQLADDINADELIILTAVDNVYIHYNTPQQKKLDSISVNELQPYIEEGMFASGSMLPKVQAAIKFVKGDTHRRAIITSLDRVSDLIDSESTQTSVGTLIHQ